MKGATTLIGSIIGVLLCILIKQLRACEAVAKNTEVAEDIVLIYHTKVVPCGQDIKHHGGSPSVASSSAAL